MSPTRARKATAPELDDTTLDDALVSLVERFPEGLATAKVRALLPPPYQATKVRIDARLGALVAAGRVFRWSKTALGPRALAPALSAAIREALAAGPRTIDQLKKALPRLMQDKTAIGRAVEEAVRAGAIFEHPDPKRAAKSAIRYGLAPADATKYLAPIEKVIAAAMKKLARSGIDRATLVGALLPGVDGQHDRRRAGPAATAAELFDAILSVRPDARRHVLVSIAEVRGRLSWPKPAFDDLVLDLAREQRLTLHHHDYPGGLTPAERDALVVDRHGNYYVGLVLEEPSA